MTIKRFPMMHRKCWTPALAGPFLLLGLCLGNGADAPMSEAKKQLTKADFEQMMHSLSNSGRWGKEDQRGALNLITPEKRRQAAALVKEGITLSLAHNATKEPLDGSPAFIQRMTFLPKAGDEMTAAAD